jgi:hypothetical protein
MTEEKEFYEQLGKLLSTPDGVKELNKHIFKDGIITINILAKDNIEKDSIKNFSKFYYINSLEIDGNLSSELKNFVENINLYLQNNGTGNGYKDSKNNWSIFYLLKELITELKLNKFNYFRGQRENWDTIPGVFRKKQNKDGYDLYSKFEQMYKSIAQEFPEELEYISLDKNKDSNKRTNQLAILQHYGLPTSLLDITENPYIAMLFMLSEEFPIFDPQLEAYAINADSETSIVSFVNKYRKNKRIKAQKGAFLNYEKLRNIFNIYDNKISEDSNFETIERVIIKLNFSIEQSIKYLEKLKKKIADSESSANNPKLLSDLDSIFKKYTIEDRQINEINKILNTSTLAYPNYKDSNLTTEKIDELISLFQKKGQEKEIKQVYYKEIQQELIEKLKEYEYYTSELFPDFEDYISYKTKEFSIVGESNKITPSPISRLRN